MTITNKIVYVKHRATFESLISTIPTNLKPIVFIEDSRELWTCGTYFSIGYPKLVVSESSSSIIVTLGDSSFSITATGSGISVRKGSGNTVVINCSALTEIKTDTPLQWIDSKLIHMTSGVIPGNYGETSDETNANTLVIPNLIVNSTGHITLANNRTVIIRDYVEQIGPTSTSVNRNVLLSYNQANAGDETSQVRKANGLLFNDSTKKLSVEGGITTNGDTTINANLNVNNGYIYGDVHGDITGEATPRIHLSTNPNYGGSSTTLYGHVKLRDDLPVSAPDSTSTNTDINNKSVTAVAASPLMVWRLKEYFDNNKIVVTGYNGDSTVDLSSKFTFSKDFKVDTDNILLEWGEIN